MAAACTLVMTGCQENMESQIIGTYEHPDLPGQTFEFGEGGKYTNTAQAGALDCTVRCPGTWEVDGDSLIIVQESDKTTYEFGDSVTDGGFLHDAQLRWQNRFVAGLQKRFPQSRIRLQTVAWGGRNTNSFLAEPPGSPHNYAEKVLAAEPDLIISEFVNDAGLPAEAWEANYNRFRKDLK